MTRPKETTDEVIEGIHAVREAYAARFHNDIRLLFRHVREQTAKSDRKVVRREPRSIDRAA
jgi:hypothetical protein